MTKRELVKELGKVLCNAKEAQLAVNTLLDTIIKTVKNGENVALMGFGTFKLAKRAARKGQNPRTGETIKIKATKVPRFSAGKAFKDAVKN